MRLRYRPAITRNGYLSGIGIFPADVCPFAILSSPGLLCRSEQSREPSSSFVCSFTGPARFGMFQHAPARSRHTPGTRLDLPRRIRHKPLCILCGALCPLAILRGTLCRYSLLGMSRGKPMLFLAQTRPPGMTYAGLGMPAQLCRLNTTFGHDFGLPGVSPPTVVPEAVVALWR